MTEVTQPQSNEPIAGLTTEAVKRIKGEELDPNGIVELFQEPAYAGIPPLDVWAQVGNLDLALLTIDNIQLIRNIGNQILKESQSDTSLDSNALDALTIIAERVSKIGDFVLESTFQPIDVIGMCKDIDLETPDTILDEFRKLPNIIQEEELYIWATASKIPLSSISFPNLIFLIQIGARINGLENPEQAIKKPELDGLVVLTGELNERITSLTIEQTETPNANLTPNEIATLLDEVKTTISGKKLHPNQVVKLFKKKESKFSNLPAINVWSQLENLSPEDLSLENAQYMSELGVRAMSIITNNIPRSELSSQAKELVEKIGKKVNSITNAIVIKNSDMQKNQPHPAT